MQSKDFKGSSVINLSQASALKTKIQNHDYSSPSGDLKSLE